MRVRKMIAGAVMLGALVAVPCARAQGDELLPFRICSSVEDSLERLVCFDAAASGLPPTNAVASSAPDQAQPRPRQITILAPPAHPVAPVLAAERWQVQTQPNRNTVIAALASTESNDYVIFVECVKRRLRIEIDLAGKFASADVQVRGGDGVDLQTISWRRSPSGAGIVPGQPGRLWNHLVRRDSLTFYARTTHMPFKATFLLNNVREQLAPLVEYCELP